MPFFKQNGLFKDTRGNVAMMFAIAMVPMIVAAGGAVDYTRAVQLRMTVQDALDTAALAAGREIGHMTDSELHAKAEDFYLANLAGKMTDPPEMTTEITGGTIEAKATLVSPNTFLGIMGLKSFDFDLVSQVTSGVGTLEVVLALDNSSSMGGTKISTLRTAATDLVTTLFNLGKTSTKTDPVKIGLVPFAAAVNVGSGYASASWMDTGGTAPYHGDSMDGSATTVNNFTLFSTIKDTSWGGCVEERKAPYDVDDTAPTGSATRFVPMFAPDEPDNWTCPKNSCSYTGSGSKRRYNGAPSGSQDHNNYLPDSGGTCGSSNSNWTCANGNDNCGGSNKGVSEEEAFQRTCKYGSSSSKVTPSSVSISGFPGGPNFMCTATAVTPLSTSQSSVKAAISAMQANGYTNITAGVTWGWRLLSSGEPFTQGRAYTDDENQKILILMTDGENTYIGKDTFLKSTYGAWGYISEGHLGTTSTSNSTVVGKMNDRLALACTNAKAAGIIVYTVAFQVTDSDTLDLLKNCATQSDMAFQSSSTSALLAAFTAIGDDISSLRVSK